jgi:hypothetical protein
MVVMKEELLVRCPASVLTTDHDLTGFSHDWASSGRGLKRRPDRSEELTRALGGGFHRTRNGDIISHDSDDADHARMDITDEGIGSRVQHP